MPSPFPWSPVIREWSWKKTQKEKKYFYQIKNIRELNILDQTYTMIKILLF